MRLGIYLGGPLFKGHNEAFLEVARIAEDVGIDDYCMGQHLAGSAAYAGRPAHHPDEPSPEPMATLAAIAGFTTRLRLIGVLIAPLYPAVYLAKAAATVHALTGGRFVLALTTGWDDVEYGALGVPFDERGPRLDDALGACRALWSGAPASFSSPTVSFSDMVCVPRPEHPEDIPIWQTGAFTRRLMRRMVGYGQGWMPFLDMQMPLQPIGEQVRQLREAMAAAGRDVSSLEISVRHRSRGRSLAQALEEDMPVMAAAGINHLYVPLAGLVPSLDEARKPLEELARTFDPYRSIT